MNQQRGGTLIGFVVGVVVGLAVALAVAVYVTKVPVPFMNKAQSRTAEQDAAEAKKNKDWDPNAPLYGKNPARPASAAASGVVAESATPAASAPAVTAPKASAPVATPAAAPAASAPKPASSDPLGDLAKAKAAAAPAAKPASAPASAAGTADPFTYFVQTGAYRTPEDAETQRAKLALMGVDAKVSEREQSGRTVYRVRVGPFEKKDEADKLKEKLDAAGIETAMVRVQR